jgi:hypothetical protein
VERLGGGRLSAIFSAMSALIGVLDASITAAMPYDAKPRTAADGFRARSRRRPVNTPPLPCSEAARIVPCELPGGHRREGEDALASAQQQFV